MQDHLSCQPDGWVHSVWELVVERKIAVVFTSRDTVAVGLVRVGRTAERLGASLHIIDITEPDQRWLRVRQRAGHLHEQLETRRSLIERLVSNAKLPDVGVTVEVRSGRPIVELVRSVAACGAQLVTVIAPARPESPPGVEAMISRLVRQSPVSVLVMRPLAPGASGTIVAVDIIEDETSHRLNERLLEEAHHHFADELSLVHVLVPPSDSQIGFAVLQDREADLPGPVLSERRSELAALAASVGLAADEFQVDVLVGHPVEMIDDLVRHACPANLVVGTVSRSGVAGLLIGNTAEALLRQVDCSVLVVKPAGFRSPIAHEDRS